MVLLDAFFRCIISSTPDVVPLEHFDFVGISENYINSLKLFRRIYGIEEALDLPSKNVNPDKRLDQGYELHPATRKLITAYQSKAGAVCHRTVELNRALERCYLDGAPAVNSASPEVS